jgi:hypothetical protein
VLWLAALHDLVLRDPTVPAARWDPSVVGRDQVPPGDPWPDVRETVLDHEAELRAVIATRSTQTNEVNRCVYLAPALALATADLPDRPVVLVEMGASAGLLLGVDRYLTELTGPPDLVLGDPASAVRCAGADRSEQRLVARTPPPGPAGGGDPARPGPAPGGPHRRGGGALAGGVPLAGRPGPGGTVPLRRRPPGAEPPTVVGGDMVDDLATVVDHALAEATNDAHLVAISSWALTYVELVRRPRVATTLAAVARGGRPSPG